MTSLRKSLDFFGPWVLALAVLTGFLYVLPPLLTKRAAEAQGRVYTLPNLNHLSDDALYYFPRAREIYDGHFPIEMHFAEYKDTAWFVYPPLPQAVTAGFMMLTRGDVSSAVIGLIFVFSIINFLCFYAAVMTLTRSRLWSAAAAAAALFTHLAIRIPAVFYQEGVAIDIIANMVPRLRIPAAELPLVRIDDPLLTLPLFLVSFILLFHFSREPTVKRGVIAGAALGILTYIYLYYWVAIFTIAGLLLIADAIRAYRRGSYALLTPWIAYAAAFFVVFLPQIINFLVFRSLPGGPDYIIRKGIESGWGFRWSVYPEYLFYIALAAAAFWVFGRKRRESPDDAHCRHFYAAVLGAMALLWNTQLFIGFNMEPFHWWKTFAPLLLILAAGVVHAKYIRAAPGWYMHRVVAVVLVLFIAGMTGKKVLNAAAFLRPSEEIVRSYSVPASIGASWDWVNAETPAGSAIISPSLVSMNQISMFTHADPWMPASLNSVAPTMEIERRFVEANKILGASEEEMLGRLADPPWSVPLNLCAGRSCAFDRDNFRDRSEFIFEFYPHELIYAAQFNPRLTFDSIIKNDAGPVPPEYKERLAAYYAAYQPRPEDFPEHTYVYIGPWERLLSRKAGEAFANIKPAFENEDVKIYRIR